MDILTRNANLAFWDKAGEMDDTIRVEGRHLERLRRKQVLSQSYDRATMFARMARRQVSIYREVPVLVRHHRRVNERQALIQAFSTRFPPKETSRVQVGPSHAQRRLPVREIMRRWSGGRAIVGVTDLHIRGTRVEEVIDTEALSDFNTLIRGSEDLSLQEMMTLVIASPGNVTDSHSDDPDGTNHCFFGKKLWLAWDAFEGMAAGLEDVERQNVEEKAKFDMDHFLSLKSSRWFMVSSGDTLYLPGNMTHKVLTLEPYLGVGSFHIGLPGSLDTFTRWLHHGPLWSRNDPHRERSDLVDEAAKVTLQIAKRACAGTPRTRHRWGAHAMQQAYATWHKATTPKIRKQVLRHPDVRSIIELAKAAPLI